MESVYLEPSLSLFVRGVFDWQLWLWKIPWILHGVPSDWEAEFGRFLEIVDWRRSFKNLRLAGLLENLRFGTFALKTSLENSRCEMVTRKYMIAWKHSTWTTCLFGVGGTNCRLRTLFNLGLPAWVWGIPIENVRLGTSFVALWLCGYVAMFRKSKVSEFPKTNKCQRSKVSNFKNPITNEISKVWYTRVPFSRFEILRFRKVIFENGLRFEKYFCNN